MNFLLRIRKLEPVTLVTFVILILRRDVVTETAMISVVEAGKFVADMVGAKKIMKKKKAGS